jgi:Tol biopolymer transport system component
LTAFSIIQVSAQEKSYFLSTPSLSPDGKTAYFAYDGDLWKVDSNGGNASRITALDGKKSIPVFLLTGNGLHSVPISTETMMYM